MKLSKFIETLKEVNYNIFVENKNKLPQGQVPDEVEVYIDGVGGRNPIIEVKNGDIIIR